MRNRRLLVLLRKWERCCGNIQVVYNSRIQAKISSTNTDFVVTPGVKTSQLQALLVYVKKAFKNQ